MWNDPIVEEIHEIRRRIAQEHGNDIQAIGRYFMERQRAHADRLKAFPPRRPEGWVAPSGSDPHKPAGATENSSPNR